MGDIKELLEDYTSCDDDEECVSGKCINTRMGKNVCQPTAGFAKDKDCYTGRHDHCVSEHYCQGSGNSAKCTAKIDTKENCDSGVSSAQCANDGICTHIRAGKSNVCRPSTGFADGDKCYAGSHDMCASDFCHGIGNNAKCRACSVKPGETWSKPHSGTCGQVNSAGCCNNKGHDVGYDQKCTQIKKNARWAWTETGNCIYGCCNSEGYDAGWSYKCDGVAYGVGWSKKVSGNCVYGCRNSEGYDAGWSYKCDGVGYGGGWSKSVSGTCQWGCCTSSGYMKSMTPNKDWWKASYCGTGITSGKSWSRTDTGTCGVGCCNSNGGMISKTKYCSTGYPQGAATSKSHSGYRGSINSASCCNNKGHDIGWTNYCASHKIKNGQPWNYVETGECVWKCCKADGTDDGW